MTLDRIWKIGVTGTVNLEDQKLMMFSNGIYFIMGSVLLTVEIFTGHVVRIFSHPTITSLTPFLLIGLAAACLIFNRFQMFQLSRILFVVCWTFMVTVLPIITRGPMPTNYFFHPFYTILFSPIIHLLFSRPKDRYFLIFLLTLSALSVIFSVDFLILFDKSETPGPPLVRSLTVMRVNFAVLWTILNLLMAYILRTYWNFYVSLEEQKEVIAQQGTQLQIQNEQVLQLNEVLEKRVSERTQELTDRNKILSDYAFMNAHLLRTPVSRIKGLINLFQISEDPQEKKIIEQSLLNSAEELDQVVHSISKKLNEVK